DAANQPGDARGLGAMKAIVLAVDVVNDLSNRAQRSIAQRKAPDECLEGAVLAGVRVFGFEHVEAQFPRAPLVAARRDELESRFGIDEAANQPRTGDAIDVHAGTRHPRSPGL